MTAFGPPKPGTPGERAIRAFQDADELDALPCQSLFELEWNPKEAQRLRASGEALLQPAQPIEVSVGEAIPQEREVDGLGPFQTSLIVETLDHPTTVSAGASGKRLAAAERVGVLQTAVDAAHSARATNSLEKMLCHQMAAGHLTAMLLLEKSQSDRLQPGEVVRFTNAAARMMDAYQNACLVLQKLKTKGTQRVVVQYQQVNVSEGGQAVVAGRVGSRTKGRRAKDGGSTP